MPLRLLSVFLLALTLFPCLAQAENWNGWRGPRGDGTSLSKNLPTEWDGETGKNVVWKVETPGEGHASPVIWEDRLFLVTCLTDKQERRLVCIDRKTGKTLWQTTVLKALLETKHKLNSYASSTPATDGKFVYVAFLEVDGKTIPARNAGNKRPITPGEMVVAAYDFDGKLQWKVKAGEFVSVHGFCSSPVLYEDLVIVNGDHDGDGYIVALDRADGTTRWKVKRDNNTRSYVTPIIRKIDGRTQMILGGSLSVASYDPLTGSRHWDIDGPTEQFVASMVYDGKLLFLTAGFPERHILAIRPDGKGNVTDTHIAWRTQKGASYVPSPIVQGKYFLLVSDNGIANCFDTASGERFWTERIGPRYSASLITAGGLVYFISDKGVTTVVRPGREYEKVAENKLGELCFTSPAISGDQLFIRGEKHLFCIGKK